jgi:hypothetical protein
MDIGPLFRPVWLGAIALGVHWAPIKLLTGLAVLPQNHIFATLGTFRLAHG